MVNSRKSQHQRSSSSSSSSLKDKLSDSNQSIKPIPTSKAYNSGGFKSSSPPKVGVASAASAASAAAGGAGEGTVRNSKDSSSISGGKIYQSSNRGNQEMVLSSKINDNRSFDVDDDVNDGPHIYINNNNNHRSYSSSDTHRSTFPQHHHYTGEAAASNSGSQHPAAIARPELNPLVRQTTTASIALLFGLLIWRSLTSFELASQFTNSSLLLLALVPSVALLVTNIAGFLLNIIKPYNFKNHLKVILAINIVREWIELIYSLIMIVIWSPSSSSLPRETYFGSIFMNIWWCVVCFSFSRSRWVLKHTLSNSEIKYLQQRQLYEQQQRRF
jgi:hypothetical protein